MKIIIPQSKRKKALIIVDVQPNMMKMVTKKLIPKIARFIENTNYALYVEATWSADKKCTFYKQTRDFHSSRATGATSKIILDAVKKKNSPMISLHKNTRSAFKAAGKPDLQTILKKHNILEVHLLGVDINDCVLATALDSTDLGFYTYLIEELSHHSKGSAKLKASALNILRHQCMTNNSLLKGSRSIFVRV